MAAEMNGMRGMRTKHKCGINSDIVYLMVDFNAVNHNE